MRLRYKLIAGCTVVVVTVSTWILIATKIHIAKIDGLFLTGKSILNKEVKKIQNEYYWVNGDPLYRYNLLMTKAGKELEAVYESTDDKEIVRVVKSRIENYAKRIVY